MPAYTFLGRSIITMESEGDRFFEAYQIIRWHMTYAELAPQRFSGILDVEASHLAFSKTENVSDSLVF
jgi:hypothetical protein